MSSSFIEAGIADTATSGRKIRTSHTVREYYRELAPDLYGGMDNKTLSNEIGRQFTRGGSGVRHYTRLDKKGKRELGELRVDSRGVIFVSALRDGYIDVLTIRNDWFKPKYVVKDPEKIKL
jgi:hypothetical protein